MLLQQNHICTKQLIVLNNKGSLESITESFHMVYKSRSSFSFPSGTSDVELWKPEYRSAFYCLLPGKRNAMQNLLFYIF